MFSLTAHKLKQQLLSATERITVAETELSAAMADLTVSERADKQIVGERLRKAMAELVAARLELAALVEAAK